jgi:hypothetical protein
MTWLHAEYRALVNAELDGFEGETLRLEIEAEFFGLGGGYRWARIEEALHLAAHLERAAKCDVFVRQENARHMRKRARERRAVVIGERVCKHCGVTYVMTEQKVFKKNKGACSQECAARHQSCERVVTIGDETRRIGEWLAHFGISKNTLKGRVSRGWSIEEALTTKPMVQRNDSATARARTALFTHDGESLTLSAWCARTGLPKHTVAMRLRKGWAFDAAITTPVGSSFRGSRGQMRARVVNEKPTATSKRLYEVDGVARTLRAWAKRSGVAVSVLRHRLGRGLTLAEALLLPKKRGECSRVPAAPVARALLPLKARPSAERFAIDGEERTLLAWCRKYQASPIEVRGRLAAGWTLADALRARSPQRAA